MSEVSRKEGIIEYPENYDEMTKKLIDREEEKLKKALEKRDVNSLEDLKDIVKKELHISSSKYSGDRKPVKGEVISDATHPEITLLYKTLATQFPKLPSTKSQEELPPDQSLAGRIKQGNPTSV